MKPLKDKNIFKILKIVSEKKKIARKDLAKSIEITPAGITKITKKLIDKGYLIETEKGDSIGGRPPIMLELNPNKFYIIGVYYAPKEIKGVLMNLHSEVLHSESIEIKSKNKEKILEIGYEIIDKLILKAGDVKVMGIGVSLNGVVDTKEGISLFSPHYRWRDVPMKSYLEDRYDCHIFMDNDVRMMAIAEKECGAAKDNPSFIMLNIGEGIGAGIVINNQVFHGGSYSAGEVGHLRVREDGKRFCSCGKKGCLEAEISTENILLKVKEEMESGEVRTNLSEIKDREIGFNDICEGAKNGDYYCVQVIEYIGKNLGKALGNVVNIINPELLVINGEINKCKEILYPVIKLAVQRYSMYNAAKILEIRESELDQNGASVGAAAVAYREIFDGVLELK